MSYCDYLSEVILVSNLFDKVTFQHTGDFLPKAVSVETWGSWSLERETLSGERKYTLEIHEVRGEKSYFSGLIPWIPVRQLGQDSHWEVGQQSESVILIVSIFHFLTFFFCYPELTGEGWLPTSSVKTYKTCTNSAGYEDYTWLMYPAQILNVSEIQKESMKSSVPPASISASPRIHSRMPTWAGRVGGREWSWSPPHSWCFSQRAFCLQWTLPTLKHLGKDKDYQVMYPFPLHSSWGHMAHESYQMTRHLICC